MADKQGEKVTELRLILQRGYLMFIAKYILKMTEADIGKIFKCSRQVVFAALKNYKKK